MIAGKSIQELEALQLEISSSAGTIQQLADGQRRELTPEEKFELGKLTNAFEGLETAKKFVSAGFSPTLLQEPESFYIDEEGNKIVRPQKGRLQSTTNFFAIDVDGRKIRALGNNEKLSALFPRGKSEIPEDEWLRDFILMKMGKRPKSQLTSGEGLVPTYLSSKIIDDVRAKSCLLRAGTLTLPISAPTSVAKLTGDPTAFIHEEGEEDIGDSIPSYEPVTLNPKAHVAAVPLTEEVVEDSPNLDSLLRTSLAGAFALSIDNQGIAKILSDDGIAKGGEATDSWAGVMAAVSAMLAADQEVPRAGIFSPADFMGRAGQLAVESGTWLGPPPILAGMLDLETSNMADGVAILGDFAAGVALAMRRDVSLEIVRFKHYKKFSHLLMAYLRGEIYVLQSKRLYLAGASGA